MAVYIGVRIEGLRETVRSLEKAGVEVSDLRGLFGGIASDAAHIAAEFAPLGATGRLRASIRGNRAKNKAVVRAGRKLVPYAPVINWGAGPRPGLKGPHNIRASKFLQRAEEVIRPTIDARVHRELDQLFHDVRRANK